MIQRETVLKPFIPLGGPRECLELVGKMDSWDVLDTMKLNHPVMSPVGLPQKLLSTVVNRDYLLGFF